MEPHGTHGSRYRSADGGEARVLLVGPREHERRVPVADEASGAGGQRAGYLAREGAEISGEARVASGPIRRIESESSTRPAALRRGGRQGWYRVHHVRNRDDCSTHP